MKFGFGFFLFFLIFPLSYLFFKYFSRWKVDFSSKILFSSVYLLKKEKSNYGYFFRLASDILLTLSISLFIVALARPLGGSSIQTNEMMGIDIVICLDVSGSMLNYDGFPTYLPHRDVFGERIFYDPGKTLYKNNRLNSAKRVIEEYIDKQEFNRLALVVFAGYSYTKCPLTLDREMVKKILKTVEFDPQNDGTAIGMGIATGINRIKNSRAKSKIIILLTDGNNNTGLIDPLTAAGIATNYGIKIYTIGLGNKEGYLQPVDMNFEKYVLRPGEGLDENVLTKIAEITGGKFFRAYEPGALKEIYSEIDKLEKSKLEVKRRVMYKENFMSFLVAGSIFLLCYIILNAFVIRLP